MLDNKIMSLYWIYNNNQFITILVYMFIMVLTRMLKLAMQIFTTSKMITFIYLIMNYILQLATSILLVSVLFSIDFMMNNYQDYYTTSLISGLIFVHYTSLSVKTNIFVWIFNIFADKYSGSIQTTTQDTKRRKIFDDQN